MKTLPALRRRLGVSFALALVAAASGCGPVPSPAAGVATVGTGMPVSGGATLEARCQAGDGPGCRELGERYRDGAEPADVATIRAPFERACELGDAEGCADFGMLLAAAPSLSNERGRAAAAFAKGCARGNAVACFQIVERAYRDAHGQESPEVKAAIADALAKSEASCAAATPGNCSMAAHLLRAPGSADAARADALERRAHEFSERACDAGTAASCVGLAEELRRSSKGPADLAAVAALLKRACDAGSASGCDRYGYLVDRGVAAEKGEERALMLYRRSCDLGDPSGCYSLGDALHDGKGAAADAEGARHAFARAGKLARRRCEAGLVFACHSLIGFLNLEVDLGFATSDAVSLIEAVCLVDQAFVCDSLGRLLEKGNTLVAKHEARADKLRARACAVGGAPFCPETDPSPASVPSLAGIPIWDRAARLWWWSPPNATPPDGKAAAVACRGARTGALTGWRLPTKKEIEALVARPGLRGLLGAQESIMSADGEAVDVGATAVAKTSGVVCVRAASERDLPRDAIRQRIVAKANSTAKRDEPPLEIHHEARGPDGKLITAGIRLRYRRAADYGLLGSGFGPKDAGARWLLEVEGSVPYFVAAFWADEMRKEGFTVVAVVLE